MQLSSMMISFKLPCHFEVLLYPLLAFIRAFSSCNHKYYHCVSLLKQFFLFSKIESQFDITRIHACKDFIFTVPVRDHLQPWFASGSMWAICNLQCALQWPMKDFEEQTLLWKQTAEVLASAQQLK